MTRFKDWQPHGVIPAVLLPFKPDLSIDEAAYRRHLRDVAAVAGISALTVNGHSSEVHACTVDEQREVMRVTMDELGDRLPIIAGVYADGSLEAARIARLAETDGAAALLVFPPQSMSMGGQLRPEMALAHFSTIAAATSLPLICFNYSLAGGLGYPHDTLLRLVEAVPSIRAINDRIFPIVQAFYAPPFLDMHNRMKEVLALLGRQPAAVVRPPLVKLPPHEIERLKQAIAAAGLDRAAEPAIAAE